MGQEIPDTQFSADAYARFGRRLAYETQRARHAYAEGEFADAGHVAGFELEAWLIDRHFAPIACNQAFLARLAPCHNPRHWPSSANRETARRFRLRSPAAKGEEQ